MTETIRFIRPRLYKRAKELTVRMMEMDEPWKRFVIGHVLTQWEKGTTGIGFILNDPHHEQQRRWNGKALRWQIPLVLRGLRRPQRIGAKAPGGCLGNMPWTRFGMRG
jgi:hypothetical protein